MTNGKNLRGMIAVDKIGCKILFIDPHTHKTETVLDGFQRTVHELLVMPDTGRAYVPIFGDGIHGRNPNPGHTLWVVDCLNRKLVCRTFSYCTGLMRAKDHPLGQYPTGCPPFDKEVYGPLWKEIEQKREGRAT